MPRRYPKRSQLKYTKKPYRVRNWNEYETAISQYKMLFGRSMRSRTMPTQRTEMPDGYCVG